MPVETALSPPPSSASPSLSFLHTFWPPFVFSPPLFLCSFLSFSLSLSPSIILLVPLSMYLSPLSLPPYCHLSPSPRSQCDLSLPISLPSPSAPSLPPSRPTSTSSSACSSSSSSPSWSSSPHSPPTLPATSSPPTTAPPSSDCLTRSSCLRRRRSSRATLKMKQRQQLGDGALRGRRRCWWVVSARPWALAWRQRRGECTGTGPRRPGFALARLLLPSLLLRLLGMEGCTATGGGALGCLAMALP